jgi:hypothetical protein
MYELGKAVPIIPVITKADTMTIREAQNYKQEVFSRLQVRAAAMESAAPVRPLYEQLIASLGST